MVKVPRDFGGSMLAKIAILEKKSGLKLTIPQKLLLAETGTLEQVLSILAEEVVGVKVIDQRERKGVVSRKSVISTVSGRMLVKAHTKVYGNDTSRKVMELIRARNLGIGSIIQNLQLETFRKITDIGYDPKTSNLFRKYQITIGKKLCFEIKEEFVR